MPQGERTVGIEPTSSVWKTDVSTSLTRSAYVRRPCLPYLPPGSNGQPPGLHSGALPSEPGRHGGSTGTRTPSLRYAIPTRYQLRHGPIRRVDTIRTCDFCVPNAAL